MRDTGHCRRRERPLQSVPTPYHLRRYVYEHGGRSQVFDERATPLRFVECAPPSVDGSALLLAPPPSANKRSSQIGGPAPKRRDVDDGDDFLEESDGAHTDPLTESSSEAQPSLLSPTASPRSPETSDSESPPQHNPPSARAYAPVDGSASFYLPEEMIPSPSPSTSASTIGLAAAAELPVVDLDNNGPFSNEQLSTALRQIGEGFTRLPPALHRYTLYSLLRGCNRQTLSVVYEEIGKALRLDFLQSLPPELSKLVLCELDVKSACTASLVCRRWYDMIDQDEDVWRALIARSRLPLEAQDVTHAKVERWGYHGWSTLSQRGRVPLNAFGQPANPYKAVFRRLELIRQNWNRTDLPPRRRVIRSPDKEVITCLDYSDDIIIASTDDKHHLNVYDTRRGTLLHSFNSHDGGVWALKRVNRDTIVTGSIDHTVRVWSLSKNRCTHVFRGHSATVRCLDVVMPDEASGRTYPVILSGSRDTTVRMLRLPRPEEPDYDSCVALSDADNPYFLAELRGHTESVRSLCGSGDIAVTGSYDCRVRVWEINARRCRHELRGHENKVYSVVLDTERNHCISASMDVNIKIWDLTTGAELYNLSGHTGLVGLLKLRDDTLVSGAADFTLRVWDPETGAQRHTLKGHDSAILCFDHDGERVVSGSVRDLKLWNARTGRYVRDLLSGVDHIWQVSFDRKRCVAAVARGQNSHLEILDFDFDPVEREREVMRDSVHESLLPDIMALLPSVRPEHFVAALAHRRPEHAEYLLSGELNEMLESDLNCNAAPSGPRLEEAVEVPGAHVSGIQGLPAPPRMP